MSLSTPFIHRPVGTTLLVVAITLAGGLGYGLLPVSPLPQVDFPTINVSANLPGASPETMASAVATPLERQFGRIAGIAEMTSSSSLGSTSITMQFELDRDINAAARDVQAAINAARGQLPANLPNNPSYRKINPADSPIMILALTSAIHTKRQMYDAAATILQQRLAQVPGVGQVSVGGGSPPAVRVDLNPTVLNHFGIGLEEIRATLGAANANRPKGQISNESQSWSITATDQLLTAPEYESLIVSYRKGAAIRLKDIATVTDSVEDIRTFGLSDGKPAITVVVSRQPGANIIATVDHIRALLPQLDAQIPAAMELSVAMDRTGTIRASLYEIQFTLLISVGLVILVVFVFLRDLRATFIPSVAVPVSLIGTFGAMYLAGYSLDNLSLMALTIATGFVVDDAIVVIENIMRHLEAGLSPLEASLLGAREIGFTVLSISVSLVAVFIPILLMGGIVGRLFQEFAVTLSVAIGLSLLVSLTATPMMCAVLLRSHKGRPSSSGNQSGESEFDVAGKELASGDPSLQDFQLRGLGFSPQGGSPMSAQGKRPTGVPPWEHHVTESEALKGRPHICDGQSSVAPSGLPIPDQSSPQGVALGWHNAAPLGLKSNAVQPDNLRSPSLTLRVSALFSHVSEWLFERVLHLYEVTLRRVLRHQRLTLFVTLSTIGFTVYLYIIIPKGFFPQQDTGRLSGSLQADQDTSFQSMSRLLEQFTVVVKEDPAVASMISFIGGQTGAGGASNSARMFISLKPLKERKLKADEVIARIRKRTSTIPGASLVMQATQDLRVGGRASSAQYQYTLRGDSLSELTEWSVNLLTAMRKVPGLVDVNSDQQTRGLQTRLNLDRDTAARLGISIATIDNTLYDAFGQRPVSTMYKSLNQYRVVMQVEPEFSQTPEAIRHIFVKGRNDAQVPLTTLFRQTSTNTALTVNHSGQFPSVTISFNLAPGTSLGDVVPKIEQASRELGLPQSIQGKFQGTAQAFQDSLRTQPLLILAALVAVYIVLGILYESYIHPLTILSTLPSAGVGALLALLVCRIELNVMALIGILLLIGIVKKNAIMMIDFALEAERRHGLAPEEAIFQACLLRFRPITMTTLAALFGGLPLALGMGEGAELRQPLGIAIVGGLIFSQMLTLYTTPVVYLYLDRVRLWCEGNRQS